MKDTDDKRIVLAKDSIIHLVPYDPRRFFPQATGDDPDAKKKQALPESFIIDRVEGKGSSAICYEARRIVGEEQLPKRGILKEFYPIDSNISGFEIHMERAVSVNDANRNQLYAKFGTFENFLLLRKIYENSYAIINEKRNSGNALTYAKDLNRYIPHYSYYCGIPSQPENDEFDKELFPQNISFYVWVENEAGYIQFQQYLDELCCEMQKALKKDGFVNNRIGDLDYILRCVLELTKSIQVLHRFEMYHLDLNPHNFGVQLYASKVDKNNAAINLYDTNSLLYGRVPDQIVFSSGTAYFRSEEVKDRLVESCGIQSDIYSIGAILYYALVIKEDNGVFKNVHFCEGTTECSKESYDNISVDLANSELLQSSDDTRSSFVQDKLSLIIKKALNRFGDECGTYRVAEDLAADIEKLLEETGIKKWAAKYPGYNASFKLEEKEAAYDKTFGATGAIERLLLERPLYDYYTANENVEQHNVLVLGCGAYASEFIDFALELSQVKDCLIHITVATKEKDIRKKDYLDKRKCLQDFVAVDGKLSGKYPELELSPYGYLDFCEIEFNSVGSIMTDLKNGLGQKKFSYVFVALNNDVLNESVADACSNSTMLSGNSATVAYVQYKMRAKKEQKKESLYPVCVTATLSDSKEYKLLKQMALNIHLAWYKNYINDLAGAEAEFRKKYNFSSSMENSLSIMYKLHSIGIKLDFSHPEKAALEFSQRFRFDNNGKLIDKALKDDYQELIWYEHRRWVIEKITDGWQTMPLDSIATLTTSTKDNKNKLHPCIVPSEIVFKLKEPVWHINTNKARWNNPAADTSGLDHLDRLSIEFHRHWKDLLEHGDSRKQIREACNNLHDAVSNNQKLILVCDSLSSVVNELLDNKENKTVLLEKYKHIVKQIRRIANENQLKDVPDLADELDKQMTPVVEYFSYTDWKEKDDALIRNLPFVLTYHTSFHLCVPLYFEKKADNTTSRLFSNIATALMLNPKFITYVVDGNMMTGDKAGLLEALLYASNTVANHGLQTKLNIKLLSDKRFSVSNELIDEIKLQPNVNLVEVLPYDQWQQTQTLHQFLMQNSSQRFTAIEINDTLISGYLQSANFVTEEESMARKKPIPVYRFDPITREFSTNQESAFLNYVNNTPVLFTEDLYLSKGKKIREAKPELISAYKKAWELYTGKDSTLSTHSRWTCSTTWKKLCAAYSNHIEKTCELAVIRYNDGDFKKDAGDYEVIMPDFCRGFIEDFLHVLQLSPYRFLETYHWKTLSSNTELLTMKAPIGSLKGAINKLVSNPLQISQKSLLEIVRLSDGFQVLYKCLTVTDLQLPKDCSQLCVEMLESLKDARLIRSLNIKQNDSSPSADPQSVSFVFASEPITRLFRSEGYLYELHTYYETIKSGFFDDVSSGVEITWNGEYGVKNELDVVLTKGFQTITIEVKAKNAINQEYYYKLYPLAKSFGINTIPVLLLDMGNYSSSKNDMEIQRGEELGIKTICSSTNIAQVLNNLFEEEKNSQRQKLNSL